MNIVKIIIEFVLTFIIIYLLYFFGIVRKCKTDKKIAPAEVNLILYYYDIDVKKIDLYQMIKVVSIVTTLILSVIITIISIFFHSTIILLVFCTLISILVAIICYRIIGRHYEKKSQNKQKNWHKVYANRLFLLLIKLYYAILNLE